MARPRTPRFFPGELELSKKSDDPRTPSSNGLSPSWKAAVPRWRKRRALAFLLSIGVLYVFFKFMPSGLPPVPDRFDRRVPGQRVSGIPLRGDEIPDRSGRPPRPPLSHPQGAPMPTTKKEKGKGTKAEAPKVAEESAAGHFYDGPFELESLIESLQGMARSLRFSGHNRNVLFAAATLKSASRLIPMACEMSRWQRNVVHFAYMGRDELPMGQVKQLNGVGSDCEVNWHDARPDASQYSTDTRMHLAVKAALDNINIFVHPEIYMCDDAAVEEVPFMREFKARAAKESKVVIELPTDALERLMWVTRLDAGSLRAWHRAYVDIIIQASSGNSGSIARLLRSIAEADYFGVRYPSITIEIPADIDAPSLRFLEKHIWPPLPNDGTTHTSQLRFRRRISHVQLEPLEAAIQTVEAFYPTNSLDSNILVLSPEVELSPMYYHYLFFNLLEYRYSTYNTGTIESNSLAGISLITPKTHFDTQAPFHPPPPIPPDAKQAVLRKMPPQNDEPTPFLWQAPDTAATLYFGNRWLELHSFLSLRVSNPTSPTPRVLPPTLPAFTETLYELMRLRGYTILYPNLPDHSIAIDHSTHQRIQPEFARNVPFQPPAPPSDSASSELFNPYSPPLSPFKSPSAVSDATPPPLALSPLTRILPQLSDLPELSSLPLLNSEGHLVSIDVFTRTALSEAATFRFMAGSCPDNVYPAVVPGSADDLFCDLEDGEPGSGSRPPPAMVDEWAQRGFVPPPTEQELGHHAQHQQGVTVTPTDPKAAGAGLTGSGAASGGSIQGIGGVGSPGAPMGMPANTYPGHTRGSPDYGGPEWDAERGKEVTEEEEKALEEEFKGHLQRQAGEKNGGKEGVGGLGAPHAVAVEKEQREVEDEGGGSEENSDGPLA